MYYKIKSCKICHSARFHCAASRPISSLSGSTDGESTEARAPELSLSLSLRERRGAVARSKASSQFRGVTRPTSSSQEACNPALCSVCTSHI